MPTAPAPSVAPPRLGGVDHLEWWVGNARTFAGFLCAAFGFTPVAYAGPETGRRDRVSYLLRQGGEPASAQGGAGGEPASDQGGAGGEQASAQGGAGVQMLVSGALDPDSPIAEHVRQHGDGIRDVAFLVDDVDAAHAAAVALGAVSVREPADDHDDHGTIRHAAVSTYGDTVHTLLDRSRYDGPFAPWFTTTDLHTVPGREVGLTRLDHVVGNVDKGTLGQWVDFYRRVFGFDSMVHFDDDQISTEYSALMSTVVWNGDTVVMPINEPADGRKKSQIEEYLDFYRSPGVQHIALATDDIVATVRALGERGVRCMTVPPEYYDDAKARMPELDLPWDELARLGILVDRDAHGHLLQIFTETVTDRPTVFFEVIQREGARGFGEGNFKALFEAIERQQDARGNL